MLLGFNLLLWTTHVTESDLPLLDALKKTGYDGVEIPIFRGAPEHYAAIGKAVADSGLRATGAFVMPDAAHDCLSSDAAVRDAALDHIRWAVDCLAAAGGEVLCGPFHQPLGVFSGKPPTAAERSNLVAVHKRAAAYAATRNIKLAVEPVNRFECYALNTIADAADVVHSVGAPNYGILYDTFHANIEEKDPVGVIAPNIGAIAHVHLSENDRGTPGRGHVPWNPTLKALKQGGYHNWYVIEAFGQALPDLAAATRVWREFFPSREEVFRFGHDFLREEWASA
jgi:D-psicose/D-tagatose/L-ribulose 3-epimerase